jgi:YHS domain-containing protein
MSVGVCREGPDYCFCSPDCRCDFEADPSAFAYGGAALVIR